MNPRALTSAPASSSSATQSACPPSAAQTSGVFPELSVPSRGSPLARSCRRVSTSPAAAARPASFPGSGREYLSSGTAVPSGPGTSKRSHIRRGSSISRDTTMSGSAAPAAPAASRPSVSRNAVEAPAACPKATSLPRESPTISSSGPGGWPHCSKIWSSALGSGLNGNGLSRVMAGSNAGSPAGPHSWLCKCRAVSSTLRVTSAVGTP
mmetsp:Transcript_10929/g.28112  ORF Transcript_10929/g.28112 Transcript_10929/m.28112 type:complete len:209 (-) Transcript_10929:325-951(-)